MEFPLFLLYPLYTGVIALVMLAVVPREKIRRLVVPGIIYGGAGDVLWLLVLFLLNAAGYVNYGPFHFSGLPFFPPLAWTFFFIIYLHFLPDRYPWNYFFTFAAAGYAVIFSNVLQNLGIFEWRIGRLIPPMIVYLTWMTTVTYTYQRFLSKTKVHS